MVNVVKDISRGDLIALNLKEAPFEVKRIFIVNNVPVNEKRGEHAHKVNQQLLVCLNGNIDVWIGNGKNTYCKNITKGETLLINNLVWASQIYKRNDSELMVLCSHEYDKEDYITDFEEFKRLKND